jgi:ketopantoate reductase
MPIDNARILVIGAGVNGSVCAARLFERGVDVTLLARGRRLGEIKSNGIVIENAFNQKRRVARVRVISELAPGDAYDYILVVVRRTQVAQLLPTLAANASPNVVFMNNNLDGPAEIVAALAQSGRCSASSSLAASATGKLSVPSAHSIIRRCGRHSARSTEQPLRGWRGW